MKSESKYLRHQTDLLLNSANSEKATRYSTTSTPNGKKREDPSKASTGLFLFRGQPGAPFAIVCPGGGFSYVGSLHEGFPLAMALSQKRYNAFVLRYRTGGGLKATEDLAAAISYVFENADRLQVSDADYSLWGGSAGARMVVFREREN